MAEEMQVIEIRNPEEFDSQVKRGDDALKLAVSGHLDGLHCQKAIGLIHKKLVPQKAKNPLLELGSYGNLNALKDWLKVNVHLQDLTSQEDGQLTLVKISIISSLAGARSLADFASLLNTVVQKISDHDERI
ncbi:unnamed protein product [Citrullus colocynthis]|uniref:Uncharacterized protein n=1 Tax=Citrullus colocynthis TaxID=252529 RepID=A0ABP0YPV0_9ROSI